jgi:hypothetical protein
MRAEITFRWGSHLDPDHRIVTLDLNVIGGQKCTVQEAKNLLVRAAIALTNPATFDNLAEQLAADPPLQEDLLFDSAQGTPKSGKLRLVK